MQPNQQQPPVDWQQPPESPAVTPYQPVVPVEPVQVVPQVPEVQPVAPAPVPAPVSEVPAQPVSPTPATIVPQPIQSAPAPVVAAPVATEITLQPSDDTSDNINEDQFAPGDDETFLLRWQGTEYTHDARSIKWYIIFGLVAIAAIALAVIVLKSITFAILIPVMVVALLVYVRRPPEVLSYILSRKGLHVNDKLFGFDQFKAFGVVGFNGAHSVTLIPRKRFQIGQTIYFPEEIGEQLVDMLAERLPMKEIEPDTVDKLLAKLHL